MQRPLAIAMMQRSIALLMLFAFCWSVAACGGGGTSSIQSQPTVTASSTTPTLANLGDGRYDVQSAEYDDATGEYTLFLFGVQPPAHRTADLQLARLTDEEIENGQQSYLQIEGPQNALHISPDFRIQYNHAVTETRTDPNTGRQETVIVRRESNFWTPFAGAVAGQVVGQAIGNALFSPRYYVPPTYQSGGGPLQGYGATGETYDRAVSRYQERYNRPPVAVQNRTQLRTSGQASSGSSTTTRSTSSGTSNRNTNSNSNSSRSTGSGVSGSNLQTGSNKQKQQPSRNSFGSSGSSTRRTSPSRRSSGSRRR